MLKNHDFRYLWLGRLISNAGDSIYYIVLSWYILQITDSPYWVGIFNFSIFIPNVFSFLFGHYIDTHKKKSLLIACEFGQLISVIALVSIVYLENNSPALLCFIAFIAALFGMNTYTIQDALTPKIVKKEKLLNAQTYMSFAYNGTDYFFNALTGFLINILGTLSLLIINAITFIFSIFSFSKINFTENIHSTSENESFKENVFKGFKYIIGNRAILLLALGGSIANFLFGGLNVYQVLIANEQGSPVVLGLMASSMAIGTLLGSTLLATFLSRFLSIGKNLVLGTILYGIFMLISSFFTSSMVIIVLWGISNLFLGVTHVNQKPFFQTIIPEQHLGKVFSALFTFSVTTLPVGSLLFGLGAKHISNTNFLLIFGCVYILVGFIYFLNKSIYNFDSTTTQNIS